MERNVEVVKDLLGNKVVVIQDIRFKGKRAVRWSDVEKYLKLYLYDIIKIKRNEQPFPVVRPYSVTKPISYNYIN